MKREENLEKKAIFFGGKQVGYNCLDILCQKKGIDLSLIVSNKSDLIDSDDRWYPCIKDLADRHNVQYVSTDKPNGNSLFSIIKNINPDIIFVVYYDNILSSKILDIPSYGTINLHLADSERYRGVAPTLFAILNGEKEHGVTLHYVEEKVDSGPIIDKKLFTICGEWTGRDLYDAATSEGTKLFEENMDKIIMDQVSSRPQRQTSETKLYKKSDMPSHELNFNSSLEETYNKIKALTFPPFPPPFFLVGKKKFFIYESNRVGKN